MFHTALLTYALLPLSLQLSFLPNHGLAYLLWMTFTWSVLSWLLLTWPRCPTPHPNLSPGTACSRGMWMGPSVWVEWRSF